MVGLCPASCGNIQLVGNPSSCTTDVRRKTLSRLLLFPCTVSLPSTLQGNIKPLFDSGDIVATSELGNFTINDPQTEDIAISSCRPAKKITTTREIVFQDRISVEFTTGSPAVTNKYWDYEQWKDKLQYEFKLYSMWVYCDGDVIIPKDMNGNLLPFSLMGFINWQQPANQGGAWIEFKQFSMVYQGDPFYFQAPDFNLDEEGITL